MRFPWLQVDADFIAAHAGDLGAHLGISRREAIGLALDLWTWALARASDDAPPDGLVMGTGPVPDRLLSGSVGWTGPAEQLTEALVACGLAARIDGGYRLTGFDRYRATWEKNRRRAGKKPEGSRTGTGEKPGPKTQTQTQTQRKKKEDPPNPPGGEVDLDEPSPAAPGGPAADSAWTVPDAVAAVHVWLRNATYPWSIRDDEAARRLLALCVAEGVPRGTEPEEIGRRFGRALVRLGMQYEPNAGKAATLRELARPECWARNAKCPVREQPARDSLSGVVTSTAVEIEPWEGVLQQRREQAA
jgi:hypothetical protein